MGYSTLRWELCDMGRKDAEKEADYNFKWCETDWAPQEVHPGAPGISLLGCGHPQMH